MTGCVYSQLETEAPLSAHLESTWPSLGFLYRKRKADSIDLVSVQHNLSLPSNTGKLEDISRQQAEKLHNKPKDTQPWHIIATYSDYGEYVSEQPLY